jgi:hypothetical protein
MYKTLISVVFLTAAAAASPAKAQHRYYGNNYYHGGCGNCWIGPAVGGFAAGVVTGAILSQPRAPVYVYPTPVPVMIPPSQECIDLVYEYVNGVPSYRRYCR